MKRYLSSLALLAFCAIFLTACLTTPINVGDFGFEPGEEVDQGIASWYGPGYEGNMTASGEKYNPNAITAAHPSLPFNSKVKVVNLDNGKELIVRINDRGPFVQGRVIDLSRASAEQIGMLHAGLANVKVIFVQ